MFPASSKGEFPTPFCKEDPVDKELGFRNNVIKMTSVRKDAAFESVPSST